MDWIVWKRPLLFNGVDDDDDNVAAVDDQEVVEEEEKLEIVFFSDGW